MIVLRELQIRSQRCILYVGYSPEVLSDTFRHHRYQTIQVLRRGRWNARKGPSILCTTSIDYTVLSCTFSRCKDNQSSRWHSNKQHRPTNMKQCPGRSEGPPRGLLGCSDFVQRMEVQRSSFSLINGSDLRSIFSVMQSSVHTKSDLWHLVKYLLLFHIPGCRGANAIYPTLLARRGVSPATNALINIALDSQFPESRQIGS